MSALSTMKHAEGCKVVRENGVDVWMCVGACPAMYEYIAKGQADEEWDQIDKSQCETVIDAVTEHALAALDARDKESGR